ncbi:MAG: histidine kinase N-terminal 7TM domain-containing protein [Eubacterium sp.]
MYYTLLILQCLGILFMFYELIRISRQRPSKFQTLLLLLVGAILINTYGYTLEITATGKELALQAVRISYLANPFILYLMYIFVMKYCGFSIPKAGKCILFSLAAFISVLVFTSDYNTLFYSHISFSYSGLFPHLILTHGPVYKLYTAFLGFYFVSMFFACTRFSLQHKSRLIRKQVFL